MADSKVTFTGPRKLRTFPAWKNWKGPGEHLAQFDDLVPQFLNLWHADHATIFDDEARAIRKEMDHIFFQMSSSIKAEAILIGFTGDRFVIAGDARGAELHIIEKS